MDVDRVQKINNLALELMKQGLVQDREEAIKQAERILAKKDYSSLNEAIDEVKELNLDSKENKKVSEGLSQDKIKEILEKNTSFTVKKMKEYHEQIEGLKREIGELKKEISGIKYNIDNLPKEPPLKEAVKEEQQKLEKEDKRSSTEEHPRSGSYNDSDVSIERFFYSGSKPKD